jgi:hypothetical protein
MLCRAEGVIDAVPLRLHRNHRVAVRVRLYDFHRPYRLGNLFCHHDGVGVSNGLSRAKTEGERLCVTTSPAKALAARPKAARAAGRSRRAIDMSEAVDKAMDDYAELCLKLDCMWKPHLSLPGRPDVCWYDDESNDGSWCNGMRLLEEMNT